MIRGGVFGYIGFACILFLASRLVLLAVIGKYRKEGKTIPDRLKNVLQFVTKYHRYVGITVVGVILLHAILQIRYYGFIPPAGLVAGLLMLTQGVLGLGLTKQKDKERRKKMALLHRILGILLVTAVLVHRIIGYLTK